MKRIVLTPVIEGYASSYLNDLNGLSKKPTDRLVWLRDQLNGSYYDYVDTIIKNYDDIIIAKPDEMTSSIGALFASFASVVNLSNEFQLQVLQKDGTYNPKTKKFYIWITEEMGYDDVQEQVFPKYIKKMGIKSCVYCNTQYAVSAKKGKTVRSKMYRGTFTLDHYMPKSEYPYLATSFFNLYPACATCNQTKSTKPPIFELYIKPTDPVIERNPFVFNLDKESFIKYSMTGEADSLKIEFKARPGIPTQRVDDFEDCFHVEKLYDNMTDTVEEIIWKYRVYNKAGRQALFDGFSPLLTNKSDWNRFVLGNYDKEKDIHKRPLAKLVQDVAKQLGII